MTFLIDHNEIQAFCTQNGITIMGGMINPDGSFIAQGDVNLSKKGYETMPVRITGCTGNFDISYNKLVSLEGVPNHVTKHFDCSNNKLTSLQFFPTEVASCNVKSNPGWFTLQDILNTGCYVSGGISAIQINTFEEEKAKIDALCTQYNIKNYTVNNDLTVDVNGNVDLSRKNLTQLPFQFGRVGGFFYCNGNKLTYLEGAASSVGGSFDCNSNQLRSLKGSPEILGDKGSFDCSFNLLISLEGAPLSVGGTFSCNNNSLSSLKGAPSTIGYNFNCDNNRLFSLEGSPTYVGIDYVVIKNPGNFTPSMVREICTVKGRVYTDRGSGRAEGEDEENPN